MIGDIGGFNGAIIILPSYILASYSARMYSSSIQEEIPVSNKKSRNRKQTNQSIHQSKAFY